MGLLEVFKRNEKKEKSMNEYFELLHAYQPAFTSFEGGLYEMDLTRAAIHSFATHVSKLKPEVNGPGNEAFARMLQYKPNRYQDTTKYLYRTATIFLVQNNAFVVPLYGRDMETITGYYTVMPTAAKLKKVNGVLYLTYDYGIGGSGAIEFDKVGILNQFQYKSDIFGENNRALQPTMELLDTQNQGIIEGVKSSASIRFLAKLAMSLKGKDIEEERKRFVENNLAVKNNGGVLLIDQKYEDVKQLESKPYVVDADQMAQIKENVFNYFGTNEKILQNKYTSNEWNAYYEGKIEPFAIQLSLVLSNMTFTPREIAFGNNIIFTANRLQYLSNEEKLNTVTQLFDRGFLTHNEGLEIFNMPGIGEAGDKRYIRKEYAEAGEIEPHEVEEGEGDE